MADQDQATKPTAGGVAPSAPPAVTSRDRQLNFIQDQLAGAMANAALATSMYGKANDVSEIIKVATATPDLKIGLHVPADKVTTVANQPNFTRLEMQVGSTKEIIAIPNAQLEQLGALDNVVADGRLQPKTPAKAAGHSLADHQDVQAAVSNLRASGVSNLQTTEKSSVQAVSGNGQSKANQR